MTALSENKIKNTAVFIIAAALTLAGTLFLDGKKYLFVSLAVLAVIFIGFAVRFERKNPNTRELVLIAVITSVSVLGRMAFYAFPQVKPSAAIIFLSGMVFGAESGFLIGAATGFVSNFYFGQGPWTPWQMLAFGAIGLAGGICGKSRLGENRIAISITGALCVFVIYGGIVNTGSLFMMSDTVNLGTVTAIFAAGIPMDLIHAASTLVFLFLLSKSVLAVFIRVKRKYGIGV